MEIHPTQISSNRLYREQLLKLKEKIGKKSDSYDETAFILRASHRGNGFGLEYFRLCGSNQTPFTGNGNRNDNASPSTIALKTHLQKIADGFLI